MAVKKERIIYLEWTDAASTIGWCSVDECAGLMLIKTCGYLVYEDENQIVVATSSSSQGKYTDPIAIPKSCVEKRKWVKL
jgi:hypothetical protein